MLFTKEVSQSKLLDENAKEKEVPEGAELGCCTGFLHLFWSRKRPPGTA